LHYILKDEPQKYASDYNYWPGVDSYHGYRQFYDKLKKGSFFCPDEPLMHMYSSMKYVPDLVIYEQQKTFPALDMYRTEEVVRIHKELIDKTAEATRVENELAEIEASRWDEKQKLDPTSGYDKPIWD
jgi:hypothetical protein